MSDAPTDPLLPDGRELVDRLPFAVLLLAGAELRHANLHWASSMGGAQPGPGPTGWLSGIHPTDRDRLVAFVLAASIDASDTRCLGLTDTGDEVVLRARTRLLPTSAGADRALSVRPLVVDPPPSSPSGRKAGIRRHDVEDPGSAPSLG